MFWITILLSTFCFTLIESSRILVCVPTPSISHQVVFYPLIEELLKRGHEVVFITADAMYPNGGGPANLTEINTHDISYNSWMEIMMRENITTGTKEDMYKQYATIIPAINKSFELQVLTAEVQDLIKKQTQFDLLIIEACAKPALSLSYVFKAPVILMSSLGSHLDNYEIIGAPRNPKLLYPFAAHQKLTNMTILDKLRVLWDVYNYDRLVEMIEVDNNKLVKGLFGSDAPDLAELGNNVHMLFLNVYPIWESNRPVPRSVIFIGGIHEKPQKALPKDLKTYLDSSKNGVVYFSLGTNVSPSALPPVKMQHLINAFSRLPYDVLMKWDSDELSGTGKNIKVAKWLPQADILRHPNIKAFITQGGLQSFDEALTGGVPLVGIPMLVDQWYNVERFVSLGIGVGLLMEELTEDVLVDAVNTVIDDPKYRQNVVQLRDKLRDEPQSGLERAVWWTEHVLRHKGASHLRAPAANMSWAEYLDLELMAVLALIVLVLSAVTVTALILFVKLIKRLLYTPMKIKLS